MPITSLEILRELIKFPSVTPDTTGALDYVKDLLDKEGFTSEFLEFEGVRNLYSKIGSSSDVILLLGHTDVVPVGDGWKTDPFDPVEKDGYLYGRGAADMKSGVAALIAAAIKASRVCKNKTFALLLTADEEGVAEYGVKAAAPALFKRGEKFPFCIVAEPSSSETLGDTIRVGRRGSLNGKIKVLGKQGHVAYAANALNPIHETFLPLLKLSTEVYPDKGDFPPTSFQITNISSGTGADNVIPGSLELMCNFRFGTNDSASDLQLKVENALSHLDCQFEWRCSAEPFLTKKGALVENTQTIIEDKFGYKPSLSTGGGTSDARFIAPFGGEIIELGVINKTSHQIDENVLVSDVQRLTDVFEELLISL